MSWPRPAALATLVLALACTGPRVSEPGPPHDAAPRAALARFLEAVERADWEAAYRLLAGELRARYTPERLRADHQAEPLADERLRRARLALDGPLELGAREARFPLGGGRAVRMVREGDDWRLGALE